MPFILNIRAQATGNGTQNVRPDPFLPTLTPITELNEPEDESIGNERKKLFINSFPPEFLRQEVSEVSLPASTVAHTSSLKT